MGAPVGWLDGESGDLTREAQPALPTAVCPPWLPVTLAHSALATHIGLLDLLGEQEGGTSIR